MKPTEQTVYLPKATFPLSMKGTVGDLFELKSGYFFTPEQLNQLLSDVIKDALNTAADKAEIKREETYELVFKGFSGGSPTYGNKEIITCNKESITSTFDITYQKYKV